MRKKPSFALAAGLVVACAATVVTGCSSGPSKSEQLINAKSDVATLGRDIQIWYVDNTETPAISLEDDVYFVGDPDDAYSYNSPWTATLKGGHFESEIVSPEDWCVVVFNADESIAASYSAANGLEEGNSCD